MRNYENSLAKEVTLGDVVARHAHNHKQYAIKTFHSCICMPQYTGNSSINEPNAGHPFVSFMVTFEEAFVDRQTLHLVTEYASNGDVRAMIRSIRSVGSFWTSTPCGTFSIQLAIAVDYLHKLNVIHRDLKPANVLLDDRHNVKLADFGIAKILRSSAGYGQTHIGTPLYMSPELLRRERYGTLADSWALGAFSTS